LQSIAGGLTALFIASLGSGEEKVNVAMAEAHPSMITPWMAQRYQACPPKSLFLIQGKIYVESGSLFVMVKLCRATKQSLSRSAWLLQLHQYNLR
jgi:hypothetical protein